jgi:ABC-type enterochelin transport system substrate-binding protein
VNSIKKDKTKLYLIFEKQRESKSIDKQIDRLIREAIAEANRRGRFRKSQNSRF